MGPQIDFLAVAFLLGSAQGVFLSLALWQKKQGHRPANRFLALFVLTFSINLLNSFYEHTGYFLLVPHMVAVVWPILFLYGPLLYLYARSITQGPAAGFTRRDGLHFVPFLAAYLILMPFFMFSAEDKILAMTVEDFQVSTPLHFMAVILGSLFVLATIVHIGVYLFITLKNLMAHAGRIKQEFSYTEKISMNWLRNLLVICIFLWILHTATELFRDRLDVNLSEITDFLIVVFIYIMGYMGLRQPVIFAEPAAPTGGFRQAGVPESPDINRTSAPKGKYEKSGLDNDAGKAILEMLQNYMETHRPYRDNELSIGKLAHQLGISVHYISQVINEHITMNFFDFVNGYRIEEAKQRLADPEQDSANILQLAMDVGFNSKSAFYAAFKKWTQSTPSQYRKQVLATKLTRI